jgi:hypothetical protein
MLLCPICIKSVVCTTIGKSSCCRSVLPHITFYEFEISSVTICRSGSDSVNSLLSHLPLNHVISRHGIFLIMKNNIPPLRASRKPRDLVYPRAIMETEFEKANGHKSLCVTILNSVPERGRRLSNKLTDISNKC